MAALTMPFRQDIPHYDFELVLDGRTYLFEMMWSARDEIWRLSISDADGVLISAGRPLLLGANVFSRFSDERLPPGEFVLIDTTGQDLDAEIDDMGTRVQLLYFPAADVPEANRG